MAEPVMQCVMNILIDMSESNTISWILIGLPCKHDSFTLVYTMTYLEIVYIRIYKIQMNTQNILVISSTKYMYTYFFSWTS